MLSLIWPLALIIASNVAYNIVTKETPESVNPFLALCVTYFVGMIFSLVLYFVTTENANIIRNFKEINWTSFILGFSIVGLEAGYIYLYRVGWNISIGSLTANISLAVILLFIGILAYKESFGIKQIVGAILCILGIVFINLK